jgi:transposase
MPAPYSADLRRRVLAACAAHEASRAELARRYRIGESTLYRWLEAERTEGRTTAKPHAGGPTSRFDAALLRQLFADQPDATLETLVAARYAARARAAISVSSVERLVQLLELRRKKKGAAQGAARGGAGPAGRGRGPRRVP